MPLIRPVGEQDVIELVQKKSKLAVTNALPGIIRSFDHKTVTCEVDIAVKVNLTKAGTLYEDYKYESADYPILVDLPVIFPRGGGVTLTFPIKEGDECLVVFSSRSIDFWWQNGGIHVWCIYIKNILDFRDYLISNGIACKTLYGATPVV